MGLSTSTAEYAFQLGANFVDYLITMQHNCVQQVNNGTFCRTEGFIDFIPRTDVFLAIDGFYNYNMTTNPMSSSAAARVYRIGSPSVILFGTGGSASTTFNPASGTIPLSASGLLPAGSHYQLFYTSRISFLGGANVAATANGQIHFRVTEVPEPVALVPLAFAALLLCRPRRARRCA